MKKKILFLLLTVVFTYSLAMADEALLEIPLVYPQPSNAPSRQVKKNEPSIVVKGKILINITDINPEQLSHPDLYAEYFLDNDLVYSSKDAQDKQNPLAFTLDTSLYADGKHTLAVNLWDPNGPSAIGIRDIIVQNSTENED